MFKLLKPASAEDIFVERYDLLMGWALALTNHNQSRAEDLVHDAFIQFTHRRADLAPIENTDAYLHRTLRNMYLSEVRRAALIDESSISIADFDSAEMGLRTFRANDASDHLDLQDQVRQICHYACNRKQTSKAASVLILRFFHGYYPSEIAKVLRTSRMAVDRWLQISRREAKAYITDPTSLKFISKTRWATTATPGHARRATELLGELRETIFGARIDECHSSNRLSERYQHDATIDVLLLSHLVSCPFCLDEVNGLLGLPLLAERGSCERLGRDVPRDKGQNGDGGSGSTISDSRKRYQRREKEVMEHRPQELRIAVNGFVVGSQQVNSELSQLAITINLDEPISFIEVFSEQAVRLLFFNVEPPSDGGIEQRAGVDFDCGRQLDLRVNFRGPWPALNLSYRDPAFDAVNSASRIHSEPIAGGEFDCSEREVGDLARINPAPLRRLKSLLSKLDWRVFLRPAPVTALISVLLIAIAFFFYRQAPKATITAADLLERSAVSETAIANNEVLHRTISLEEKKATGELVTRWRIEVWLSPEKGITARRLYEDGGTLIAGDWRRADGVQILYAHGRKPKLQLAPEKRGFNTALDFDDVWQLSPSAKEFTALLSPVASLHLEERPFSYLISYSRATGEAPGLVRTTIFLDRNDLRASELSLVVKQGNEQREFRFVETSYERRLTSDVVPSVFEPDAELLSSEITATPKAKAETAAKPAAILMASTELEVQLLERLNEANALVGEQISLSRSSDGRLRVEGVVDTPARKAEILRMLGPVMKNPSITVGIDTVAEAQTRQSVSGERPSSITLEAVEVTEQKIAVDPEVRRYVQALGLSGDQLEIEMRRLTDRILERSLQARLHARALKQIAGRFSAEQLAALSDDARTRWRAMLTQHARAYQREIEILRRELQPLFPSTDRAASNQLLITTDDELLHAIAQLYGLTVANDESLRRSFSLYGERAGDAPVRSAQFWRALRNAENLAEKIASR